MRALYTLIIDILFVIGLCNDLARPIELPAIIMEDNQPVIDITSDLSARSKKCKHFLMLIHYIKEQIEAGLVELNKVNTLENRADILTKIVVGNEFRRKSLELLGISSFPTIIDDHAVDNNHAVDKSMSGIAVIPYHLEYMNYHISAQEMIETIMVWTIMYINKGVINLSS
jgi:hypothetical protein